ncbi:hypothetical protein [Aquimarina algiphila]|uniref:hypothetical protein n=1 Tax=Aquimarina algiphila TaxID=2047982 RepID=UPI00249233DB|nr:hypothetical protein [Aquimarina algiphila]
MTIHIIPKPETNINYFSTITEEKQEVMKRKTKRRKSTSGKSANTRRVTMISRKAKQIRKKGEQWINTIKRASKLLKKEGKL